jgi:hypothetical protein
MHVALHNGDAQTRGKFPNLPLMKLAAWHKAKGDTVSKFMPLMKNTYDRVYSSRVFSFSKPDIYLPADSIKGGIGYGGLEWLPDEIEHICPDYSFYNTKFSLGFLTRGCIRDCKWCVVPQKEGDIREHADIEEFCRHKKVVLMDNNVLAHEHGIRQIEKMTKMGIRVDFNQGLDARLIDARMARMLAALGWIRFLRLACDHSSQMPSIEKAVGLLRANGFTNQISVYVLVKNIEDALVRVEFLRALGVTPFAQPYRKNNAKSKPERISSEFARWVNLKPAFHSTSWDNYKDGYKVKQGLHGVFEQDRYRLLNFNNDGFCDG